MLKGSQVGAEKVSKTMEMEPKGFQSEPRDVPKHPLGKRVEKEMKKGTKLGSLFCQKSIKTSIQQIIKKSIVEKHDFDTKWMPK